MVSAVDIPRTRQQLARFAQEERHFMTAIIIVASRNDRNLRDVHDRSWEEFTVGHLARAADQSTCYCRHNVTERLRRLVWSRGSYWWPRICLETRQGMWRYTVQKTGRRGCL